MEMGMHERGIMFVLLLPNIIVQFRTVVQCTQLRCNTFTFPRISLFRSCNSWASVRRKVVIITHRHKGFNNNTLKITLLFCSYIYIYKKLKLLSMLGSLESVQKPTVCTVYTWYYLDRCNVITVYCISTVRLLQILDIFRSTYIPHSTVS